MLSYIIRRLLILIPTVLILSVLVFIIIELPPGDFVTNYVLSKAVNGGSVTGEAVISNLRSIYGLDQPMYVRYLRWFGKFVTGDMGYSLHHHMSVNELVMKRLPMTMIVTLVSLLFTWIIAFPIGIYSAVRQYSPGDYVVSFFGFIGLSVPQFLFALVLMVISSKYFDISIGGLFSRDFIVAPWSAARVIDLLQHLWIPMIVVGLSGTASLTRILRANLLDELKKPYVDLARARGLSEIRLIMKYPVRIAINPFISSVGWILPALVSGTVIVSVVLDLPTVGPLFLQALRAQDMALAGGLVMVMGFLTIIGTLISDVLLAIVDPRIRYDG